MKSKKNTHTHGKKSFVWDQLRLLLLSVPLNCEPAQRPLSCLSAELLGTFISKGPNKISLRAPPPLPITVSIAHVASEQVIDQEALEEAADLISIFRCLHLHDQGEPHLFSVYFFFLTKSTFVPYFALQSLQIAFIKFRGYSKLWSCEFGRFTCRASLLHMYVLQ